VLLKRGRDVGAVSLQQSGRCGDEDGFGDAAWNEIDVNAGRGVD